MSSTLGECTSDTVLAAETPGVNLADDLLSKFDDGRVSYLSCFDDDLLVISQWGGPLPTLGRIAGALLSNKALSKILSPSALGNEFEEIDDAVVDKLDEKAGDILRWGHQIGWFSEDEEQYDDWKDRISTVRASASRKLENSPTATMLRLELSCSETSRD